MELHPFNTKHFNGVDIRRFFFSNYKPLTNLAILAEVEEEKIKILVNMFLVMLVAIICVKRCWLRSCIDMPISRNQWHAQEIMHMVL